MAYYKHEVIPVPEMVLERQALLRHARELTASMYGGNTKPYELGSSEYAYFVGHVMAGEPY